MASLPPGLPLSPNMPLNPLEAAIMGINTNPYFIGLMMLLLNLGGRFLGLEITKEQEKFFTHPWIRRALFFTVLFVATRNIMVALVMTIFVVLFISILFNENSRFYLGKAAASVQQPTGGEQAPPLTAEEQDILRKLMEKQARVSGNKPGAPAQEEGQTKEPFEAELVYMKNIQRLASA